MESKVGRMGSSFYTLMTTDQDTPGQRLAYLWQRSLFRDMPNTPPRQRLEFYDLWNEGLWVEMFGGLSTEAERMMRFREYVHDGEISLCRLVKSPRGLMGMVIYDGEAITIDKPSEREQIQIAKMTFPKSLAWSNLIVKERR